MVQTIIDLKKDINKKVKEYMVQREITNKTIAIIEILEGALK